MMQSSFEANAPTRRNSGYSRIHPLILTGPLLVVFLISLVNCQSQFPTASVEAPQAQVAEIEAEPQVRIRISRQTPKATIHANGPMQVQAVGPAGAQPPQWFNSAVTLAWHNGRPYIQPAQGSAIQWNASASIHIQPSDGKMLFVNNQPYPGKLVAYVFNGVGGTGGIDLVNHLRMEDYLPGVLAKELYRNWHPQAYMAQAIAARSYAIWEQRSKGRRHFDLESTQASQAYVGMTDNQRARHAVSATRGVVLSWQAHVLPAYYSSSCGGAGQDATAAFPNARDMQPLRGRPHGAWCSASPKYRWGPIVRRADHLARRLAVWGAATSHPVSQLKSIKDIRVTYVNQAGRPVRFNVVDHQGKSYQLGPEQFRVASNYFVAELPKLPATHKLYSSFVKVRVHGSKVGFDQGHGYGHGVGMCQWGAQAMASQGYKARNILNFYYPGAQLVNAYN